MLVLSFDGKGVVMRPQGLREATAKTAASRKLSGRLSKGEKRHRKRMAEVAAVDDLTLSRARWLTSCPTTTSSARRRLRRRRPASG